MKIPEHYSPVMPYFLVPNAEEFIAFITAVFKAEQKLIVSDDNGALRHAEYSINGGTIMFGEAGGEWKAQTCSVFVVTDEVDTLYERGLENGGTTLQEPGDHGYGRAAGFQDKWGDHWWLNTPDE